ncbi:MAG TPA: hypothetical protein VL832_22405 [Puia sp.]|nr:hypothetical protein [Puia sp.]
MKQIISLLTTLILTSAAFCQSLPARLDTILSLCKFNVAYT